MIVVVCQGVVTFTEKILGLIYMMIAVTEEVL